MWLVMQNSLTWFGLTLSELSAEKRPLFADSRVDVILNVVRHIYLSNLSDSFSVVSGGHLVQQLIHPALCDTPTALNKLLYAESSQEHNYRKKG